MSSVIETTPVALKNENTIPHPTNQNIHNFQTNPGNQGSPLPQIQMQFIPVGHPNMNQQILHNPIPHGYIGMNHQMPIHIQQPVNNQIPNVNQTMPNNYAPNPTNLNVANPGYFIPQSFGNNQLLNPIQNNPQQMIVNPPNAQLQVPIGNYNQALQPNMPHIPVQPYFNPVQNPMQFNNIYQIDQTQVVDRKKLFSRYLSLCRYDSANMVKKYHYLDVLASTLHIVGMGIVFLNKRFENFTFSGAKSHHIFGSLAFLFANFYLYSVYNTYFIRRSFEMKYRDIDDQNLDNVISSLEAYKLKAHH